MLKIEIFAEYRATPYRTMLQDHKPATSLQDSSLVASQIFSSTRKPLAAFLRLPVR